VPDSVRIIAIYQSLREITFSRKKKASKLVSKNIRQNLKITRVVHLKCYSPQSRQYGNERALILELSRCRFDSRWATLRVILGKLISLNICFPYFHICDNNTCFLHVCEE
jgi:hypothetical protein